MLSHTLRALLKHSRSQFRAPSLSLSIHCRCIQSSRTPSTSTVTRPHSLPLNPLSLLPLFQHRRSQSSQPINPSPSTDTPKAKAKSIKSADTDTDSPSPISHGEILSVLLKQAWPSTPELRTRSLCAIGLMLSSKLVVVAIPFWYKAIIDAMSVAPDFSPITTVPAAL